MSATKRIAVVTGGNKGIGHAIARKLCAKFDGIVYLTARNAKLGEEAVASMKKDGLDPHFHLLDIDDKLSIEKFAEYIKENYGGLDILVNNAGMAYPEASTVPFDEQAANTIRTNFFSTLNVCRMLFPLLRPHARVVNMSSCVGMLNQLKDPKLQAKFVYEDLNEDELSQLMTEYVNDVKAGKHLDKGWGSSSYAVSKIGVTALTVIQQRKFDKDSREDIIVNAVHPGIVDTDMTSHKGTLTPAEGATAPSYLALLPPNVKEPKGQMVWNDCKVVEWVPVILPKRC